MRLMRAILNCSNFSRLSRLESETIQEADHQAKLDLRLTSPRGDGLQRHGCKGARRLRVSVIPKISGTQRRPKSDCPDPGPICSQGSALTGEGTRNPFEPNPLDGHRKVATEHQHSTFEVERRSPNAAHLHKQILCILSDVHPYIHA